jgi:hypothetical protein
MALLSFVDSAPRAYRLKVGNAYLTFSTAVGTFPRDLLEIVARRCHVAYPGRGVGRLPSQH